MNTSDTSAAPAPSPFTAEDIVQILRERGWLQGGASKEQVAWCERAAALLGPQAADRAALADLLSLVFHYEACAMLASVEAHVALSRYAARDVVRELATLVLEGGPVGSDRFQEIVTTLKEKLEVRGRELFHPLRLALTGRCGEGELDRVILLLDDAAAAGFTQAVKTARARMVEFCAALD